MVTLALMACGGRTPVPNSIRGLAVIAVEAIPPEPTPPEGLELRTWVADGLGRGADVLVWMCTPYEGRCLEAFPPGSTGLPLSIWTRTGSLDGTTFTADTAWPFLASVATQQLGIQDGAALTIGALACAPGVCPLIDQVRADPVSGSEAWTAAARALANPQDWMDELPPGQVSLAVKQVPLFSDADVRPETAYAPTFTYGSGGRPNQSPILVEKAFTDSGFQATDAFDRFLVYDPDGDELSIRPFTTAGGAVLTPTSDTGLAVMWQEPVSPLRDAVKFVVVEDGRGGTAVWTDAAAGEGCETPTLESRLPDGAGLTLSHHGSSVAVYVTYVARGPFPDTLQVWLRDPDTDTILGVTAGNTNGGFDASRCTTTYSRAPVFLSRPPSEICQLGGKPVLVEAQLGSGVSTTTHAVLKLAPDEPCTE